MSGKTYIGATRIKKIYLGSTKIKKIYKGTDQVYSSGSLVSYYNGSTLLGTREFEEGESVLSPTGISPTKSGYTFKGWAYTDGSSFDNRITSLVANGDPITLYAVFIPSSLVVFATTHNSSPSINNSRYVTSMMSSDGHVGQLNASVWYRSGNDNTSGTVGLNLRGEYARAVVEFATESFNTTPWYESGGRWVSNNLGTDSHSQNSVGTATRTSTSQTPTWTITCSAGMDSNNSSSFVWIHTYVKSITLYTS